MGYISQIAQNLLESVFYVIIFLGNFFLCVSHVKVFRCHPDYLLWLFWVIEPVKGRKFGWSEDKKLDFFQRLFFKKLKRIYLLEWDKITNATVAETCSTFATDKGY